MNANPDPLAAFDEDVIGAVAAETGVEDVRLRDLLRRHQELVRDLPGVDDLVYEWRKGFPVDPLVERRTDAYYLRLDRPVWPEFAEALGMDERELRAVRTAHARQLAAAVDTPETDDLDGDARGDGIDGGDDFVVLTRP